MKERVLGAALAYSQQIGLPCSSISKRWVSQVKEGMCWNYFKDIRKAEAERCMLSELANGLQMVISMNNTLQTYSVMGQKGNNVLLY